MRCPKSRGYKMADGHHNPSSREMPRRNDCASPAHFVPFDIVGIIIDFQLAE